MPELPSASTRLQDNAAALAQGLDVCCLIFPCRTNADLKARVFGSAEALVDTHAYCEGAEYVDLHVARTNKAVLGIGCPIDVEGAIGREDTSGNTGSCATTISALSGGVMCEHEGRLKVTRGGVIGTDQIQLALSLDGGRSYQPVRLGTENSYTEALFNFQIAFGAGSLVDGDVIHKWSGTGPRSSTADWATARANLAEKLQFFRTMLVIGDLQSSTEAQALLTQVNTYETENERYTLARASVRDRLPLAAMSRVRARMSGSPTLTFAEVGVTGDTITRSAGSWIADGFAVNDLIAVTGAVNSNNNETAAKAAALSATVITLDTEDLDAEVGTANCTVTATPSLTFADLGATGSLTRSRGSWLVDGFRAGDVISVSGTVSNNWSNVLVTAVTALVLTVDKADVAAEVIGSYSATVTAGQTKAEYIADLEDEYESIDDAPRISLGVGRARVQSGLTKWFLRMPAQWLVSAREYQHDVHVATWRKSDGSLQADLNDENGELAEWDDRVDGGAATRARFTSLRTWGNGPAGTFVARSLTRAKDGSALIDTAKAIVGNLACSLVQANTENAAIGVDLVLDDDGTATATSLSAIEDKVNGVLKNELLTNKKNEGQRASFAKFTCNTGDVYNVPDAEMNTVTQLRVNGTVVTVRNKVNLQSVA